MDCCCQCCLLPAQNFIGKNLIKEFFDEQPKGETKRWENISGGKLRENHVDFAPVPIVASFIPLPHWDLLLFHFKKIMKVFFSPSPFGLQ